MCACLVQLVSPKFCHFKNYFSYVMLCSIWYHLYNLKRCEKHPNMKTLKVALLHGCFSRFCINGTKSHKTFHMKRFPCKYCLCLLLPKDLNILKGLLRTVRMIYDGAFCESSQHLLAVNSFFKKAQ